MTRSSKYDEARKRVAKRKAFWAYLLSFIAITLFCIILNILSRVPVPWFIGPVLGIAVIFRQNYRAKYGSPSLFEKINERAIQREMDKMELSNDYDSPTVPDEELELKEFKKLRQEWNDQDFV